MLTLGLSVKALAPGMLASAGASPAGAWAPALALCGLCPPLLGALYDRLVARQAAAAAAAEQAHPAHGPSAGG